ncbi:MAG: nucleotidyl transferase AbiEii/AbiGii toxin family protein, partial [bacterium]|nr:nucleotidyl transferase AbiEii/AbiGii toxin family protein [bacterium]
MISQESIQKLSTQYHVPEYPNIVREYFQHLFLSELYKLEGSNCLLFKGGTALRIVYNSPRFSEDLDFTISGVEPYKQKEFIEHLFGTVLAGIERNGVSIELGPKPGPTSGGYYGEATFRVYDYQSVPVSINISSRGDGSAKGEIDSVVNDFIPTYSVYHLSQEELVGEKIFGALLDRKKARDFYDLYFIMRKGMLASTQKIKL